MNFTIRKTTFLTYFKILSIYSMKYKPIFTVLQYLQNMLKTISYELLTFSNVIYNK